MASLRFVLGMVFVVVLAAACTKTGDTAREPTASNDAASPVTTTTSEAPPGATGGGAVAPIAIHHDNTDASVKAEKPSTAKCTTDADCRLISSYCQATPCTCYVAARNEPDRKCTSDRPTHCIVDPCMKKHAKCKAGACAIVGE